MFRAEEDCIIFQRLVKTILLRPKKKVKQQHMHTVNLFTVYLRAHVHVMQKGADADEAVAAFGLRQMMDGRR